MTMKNLFFFCLAVTLVMGCSTVQNEIVATKIKRIHRSQKKSDPTEEALKTLARRVADAMQLLPGTGKKLSVSQFSCSDSTDGRPIPQVIGSHFLGYIIQFSAQGGYAVVDHRYKSSDSVLGDPLISPEYALLGRCLRMAEGYALTVRLLEVRTKRSFFQVSGKLNLPGEVNENDLIASKFWLVDISSNLVWERTVSDFKYDYQAAKSYCDGLIIDGHTDWHLPTSAEFYTMIARPVQNRQQLFGYEYGFLFKNQGCHWFLKDPGPDPPAAVGINLDTGRLVPDSGLKKYLSLFMEMECQVKCVRRRGAKRRD